MKQAAKPTISVIIPAKNEAKTITGCLNSLLTQSLLPKEIIVLDDGSTDKTASLVKRLKNKSKKIKFFQKQNQGPGRLRNFGARKSVGDILVFVDADMEFEEYFIENLTEPIIAKKSIGSWSENEWVKNWDNIWSRCYNYNQNRYTPQMISFSKGQKRVFRAILKSEFLKVDGFDATGYTDDWSLVKKLKLKPSITQAKFYHHNPSTLLEIFNQSRWIGKRDYKLGKLGTLLAIIRSNAAFSVVIGGIKAIKTKTSQFILFKLVYDLGITLGAVESLFNKKY